MKPRTLDLLARLNRPALDQVRRKISECDAAMERIEAQLTADQAAIPEEMARAAGDAATVIFAGPWLEALHTRGAQFKTHLRNLERERERLQEQMRLRFSEVKRYEVMAERTREQLNSAAEARETRRLDETASLRHAFRDRAGP